MPGSADNPTDPSIGVRSTSGATTPARHWDTRDLEDAATSIAEPRDVGRAALLAFHVAGGTRVVVAYRDSSATDPNDTAIGFATSDDGGSQWRAGHVSAMAQNAVGIGPMLGEPALAVSPVPNEHGGIEVYLAAVASVPGLPASTYRQIVISRSVDGGNTFLPAITAASSRIFDQFRSADHPSLAVDVDGRVHLAFVADAGLASERIEHWAGWPEGSGCRFSCMTWWPDVSPETENFVDAHVGAPVLRAERAGLYLVYDQFVSTTEDSPGADAIARIVATRFNPFTGQWEPTSAQPAGGRWFPVRTHVDSSSESPTVAGRFDFAISAGRTGLIAWAAQDAHGVAGVFAQSFAIRSALEEDWSIAERVRTAAADALTLQPAIALGRGVPTLSWLEQDAAGTVRPFGAVQGDADGPWKPARDLTTVPTERAYHICPSRDWGGHVAAVQLDSEGAPTTVTVHAGTASFGCDIAPAPTYLVATRWTAMQ